MFHVWSLLFVNGLVWDMDVSPSDTEDGGFSVPTTDEKHILEKL